MTSWIDQLFQRAIPPPIPPDNKRIPLEVSCAQIEERESRNVPPKKMTPSATNAKEILKSIAVKYEKHHQIQYSPESLDAAVELSNKYIFSRSLPDKAIDLIDEAGALKRIKVVSIPPDIQKLEQEKAKKKINKQAKRCLYSNR